LLFYKYIISILFIVFHKYIISTLAWAVLGSRVHWMRSCNDCFVPQGSHWWKRQHAQLSLNGSPGGAGRLRRCRSGSISSQRCPSSTVQVHGEYERRRSRWSYLWVCPPAQLHPHTHRYDGMSFSTFSFFQVCFFSVVFLFLYCDETRIKGFVIFGLRTNVK